MYARYGYAARVIVVARFRLAQMAMNFGVYYLVTQTDRPGVVSMAIDFAVFHKHKFCVVGCLCVPLFNWDFLGAPYSNPEFNDIRD